MFNHPPERNEPAILASRGRILVVDDDPVSLALTSGLLRKHNYMVLECEAGNEALTLLRDESQSIDLFITDLVMPEISGTELIMAMCDMPHRVGLPVILVTSEMLPEEIQEALMLGLLDHIRKPVCALTLHAAVRKNLEEPGNKEQSEASELDAVWSSRGDIEFRRGSL